MENRSLIDRLGGPSTVFIAAVVIVSVAFLGFIIAGARNGTSLTQREEQLVQMAEQLGMDKEKFAADLKREDVKARVAANKALYQTMSNGAQESTPSIFIDGQRASNSDFETFKLTVQSAIDLKAASTTVEEGQPLPPVEIIEFQDYQCPACSTFFPVLYQIKAEFGDKVTISHKHLPLESIHPRALSYAYGAEAAREQGKFYEFSRAAFEKESGRTYTELDGLDPSVFQEPTE